MFGRKDNKECLQVNGVIFDWSGTAIDFGSMAPAIAFSDIFKKFRIDVSMEKIRSYMGLPKIDHIKKLLETKEIKEQWEILYKRSPTEEDIKELYHLFTEVLMDLLPQYSKPIDGVVELVNALKKEKIKIGSTTGYSREMMKVVLDESKKYGYCPDCIVTPDEVPAGRPFPWMCYLNMIKLEIFPAETVIKVGDTISDITEGVSAGMWSVGIIKGSNELGLSEEMIDGLSKNELFKKYEEIRKKFLESGAHYVLYDISELEQLINIINIRLSKMKGLQ